MRVQFVAPAGFLYNSKYSTPGLSPQVARLMPPQMYWTENGCGATGGASGVGRCLAQQLAAEGAKVVITDINADKLAAVAAELTALGGAFVTEEIAIAQPDCLAAAKKWQGLQ